jgi:peroxiredoxin
MPPMLIAAVCLCLSPSADSKAPIGAQVTDLVLPEVVSGKPWRLAEQARGAKATVVAFIDSSCPVCQNHLSGLNKLKLEFEEKGLQLVGINSHPADTVEEAAQHALRAKLKFPVLRDEGGAWARKLAVDRLPCVLVLDPGYVVRYRGRIDDQFAPGVARSKPTTRDLQDAVTAVLDNRQIARAKLPERASGTGPVHPHAMTVSAVTWFNSGSNGPGRRSWPRRFATVCIANRKVTSAAADMTARMIKRVRFWDPARDSGVSSVMKRLRGTKNGCMETG